MQIRQKRVKFPRKSSPETSDNSAIKSFQRSCPIGYTGRKANTMKNQIIASYGDYNQRRYSTPWVCIMSESGQFNFSAKIGTYTGNGRSGEGGDLVIFDPQEGAVYGYGQKGYRNPKYTEIKFARYINGVFVVCDKLGREK